MTIAAPVVLTAAHDVAAFKCQHPEFGDWLRTRALKNQQTNASRTFVACEKRRVAAFYSLSAGCVERAGLPNARLRQNMPNVVPAVLLGRLAVDLDFQGQGLGGDLLHDAIHRSLSVADTIAARVLLCHAVDADARAFYEHHGFQSSPLDDLVVMLDLNAARGLLPSPP